MSSSNGVFVYVAAPYTTPDPVENTHKAVKVCNALREEGYIPFCPHLTMLWHTICPQPYRFWMEYDQAWLSKCDVLLRLPGESSGADEEVDVAMDLNVPVVYGVEELRSRFPLNTPVVGDQKLKKRFKLAIVGPAGAGKDEAAKHIRENTDLTGEWSTSEWYWARVEGLFLDGLAEVKKTSYGRESLAKDIVAYNKSHLGIRLYKEMIEDGYDIIVGIRRLDELRRCLEDGLIDEVLWISADVPADGTLNFTPHDLEQRGIAHTVIENDFSPAFYDCVMDYCITRGAV
jgi:hypothetical protein